MAAGAPVAAGPTGGNIVEQWFRLADEDRDGAVGGAEAVRFFTKSGLAQDVLGQIWELASGGGARLALHQFGVALRLVALAQACGGRLPPDQARAVAAGGGPQLPLPRLAGVPGAPPPAAGPGLIPTYTPQITGLGGGGAAAAVAPPLQPQPTGGSVAAGYGPPPQLTGGSSVGYGPPPPPGLLGQPPPQQQPPSYGAPQVTGGGYGAAAAAGPTGGAGSGGGGGVPPSPPAIVPAGFPPCTVADVQRYASLFLSADADRDGLVKGSECLPLFMRSGLDKTLLKRMWDLVAGNAGALRQDQFARCMYLMEAMRRGWPLPAGPLPPGIWPAASVSAALAGATSGAGFGVGGGGMVAAGMTGASSAVAGGATGAAALAAAGVVPSSAPPPQPQQPWSLENQFGNKGATKAVSDAYDQTLPRIPDLPGKVTIDPKAAAAAAAAGAASAVPDLEGEIASMLAPADKARWEAERAEAADKEGKARSAEAEAAAARARAEAFQAALGELVVFKSRVDVALLQAGDSAARLTAEAEDAELRYNRAYLAAQSQAEAGSAARAELQALLARKQDAAAKLRLLEEELSMMANLNPKELAALEQEVGALVAQVAAAEARRAALEMQRDAGARQKRLLGERIQDLDLAAAAGERELRSAREELQGLQARLGEATAAAQRGEALRDVGALLAKAASAYRRLYSCAAAAGIEVPYAAALTNVGALVWLEQVMAGAADWADDDAAKAYTVVNALPDLEGVPAPLLRAAAMAAAAAPAVDVAVFTAAADAPLEAPAATEGKEEKGNEEATAATAAAATEGGAAGAPPQPAAAEGEGAAKAAAGEDKEPAAAAAAAAAEAAPAAVPEQAATGGKGSAVAAAAATVAAAAGAVAATAAAANNEDEAPAADAAAAGADAAAVAPAAASEETAAGEAAPAAPAAAAVAEPQVAPAAVEAPPKQQQQPAAEPVAAEEPPQPSAAAAAAATSPPPPPAAAAAAATTAPATPGEEGARALSPEEAAVTMPAFGLAGFDPAAYRLPGGGNGGGGDARISLSSAASADSSVFGGADAVAAGATGASSVDDAPAPGADGFEDNAF